LQKNVVHILRVERTQEKRLQLEYGAAYKELDFVWCHPPRIPYDPDHLYKHFIKLLETNEMPIIRFHDLRHTHATLLLRSKVNIKGVSKNLRHTKASFTQNTYQHVENDMLQETADIMDKLFKKK